MELSFHWLYPWHTVIHVQQGVFFRAGSALKINNDEFCSFWIISLKMYNMEFSSIGPDPYPWTWTTWSLLPLNYIPENQHGAFFHWYIAEHEQCRVFFLWIIIYIHIPEHNMSLFFAPLDYIPEHVQCGVFVPSLNVSNMELSAIRLDLWPWTPWCFLQLD